MKIISTVLIFIIFLETRTFARNQIYCEKRSSREFIKPISTKNTYAWYYDDFIQHHVIVINFAKVYPQTHCKHACNFFAIS